MSSCIPGTFFYTLSQHFLARVPVEVLKGLSVHAKENTQRAHKMRISAENPLTVKQAVGIVLKHVNETIVQVQRSNIALCFTAV